MRVVGIDAGYVNFCMCVIDSDDPYRPIYWKNVALFSGPFSEEKLVEKIYEWIKQDEIRQLLDNADTIVLERQMAKKFQAVNHCIRFRYFEKTVEVSPSTIGKYFDLPIQRRLKKKAAIAIVANNVAFPIRKGKKDDYADAYLLAAFIMFKASATLAAKWKKLAVQVVSRKKNIAKIDDSAPNMFHFGFQ